MKTFIITDKIEVTQNGVVALTKANTPFAYYRPGKPRQYASLTKFIPKINDADAYTCQYVHRSSASILVIGGSDILTLKRHEHWNFSAKIEKCVDQSIYDKIAVG